MRKYFVLAGLILLTVGAALAQDFPKVETSPAFMYIRTPISYSNGTTSIKQSFNCAGGGGTFAYNISSLIGIAADLGGCKYFGQTVPAQVSTKIDGNGFTYLFGPRITLRKGKLNPFFEVNFGGMRISLSCKSSSTNCNAFSHGNTYSKNAFALTAGGGFDIRLSKKFSLRPIQAEYLYTRFGNSCPANICTNNNNQNSFRLKSGIVIAWGAGSK